MSVTNSQIQAWLKQHAKTGDPLVDYALADHADGQGAVIAAWVEAKLGPVPTQAELDAIPPAEVADAGRENFRKQFFKSSRGKDQMATCALSVRTRDIAAWNALGPQQKKAAVQAECDVWTDMRVFIEDNF